MPIANPLGVIDSKWFGNYWLALGSVQNVPIPMYYGFGAVFHNNKIYAIGGFKLEPSQNNKDPYHQNVWVYDLESKKWAYLNSLKTPRNLPAVVTLGEKIYVLGGCDEDDEFGSKNEQIDTVEVYDPVMNDWDNATVPNMNTIRASHAAVVCNEVIYVLGGWTHTKDKNTFSLATVEQWKPGQGEWKSLPDMTEKRAALAAVTIGTKIYAIGGITYEENVKGKEGEPTTVSKVLNSVEVYDTFIGKWLSSNDHPLTIAPMNIPRFGCSATVVNGKIYVYGGCSIWNKNNPGRPYLNSIEVYDPATNQWSFAASMPAPRLYSAAVSPTDYGPVYVIGYFTGLSNDYPDSPVDAYIPSI